MRFSALLCACADFGVRFSYKAISFSKVSCIFVLRSGKPSCGYLWQVSSLRSVWDGLQPPVLSEETRADSVVHGLFFSATFGLLLRQHSSTRRWNYSFCIFHESAPSGQQVFGIFSLRQLEDQF